VKDEGEELVKDWVFVSKGEVDLDWKSRVEVRSID
jgi:hypothetical protein